MNVAGGVRIDEPAIDLAIALAVASSLRDRAAPHDTVAFGEIGLAGEVRGVGRSTARIAEAAAMGFKRAVVPAALASERSRVTDGIDLVGVRTLAEAMDALF